MHHKNAIPPETAMPTLEERLSDYLTQPGVFITPAEQEFILSMRQFAAQGVGYGWMKQVIDWEWASKVPRGT